MMLELLVVLPLLFGLLAWGAERISPRLSKWTALAGVAAPFVLLLFIWLRHSPRLVPGEQWLIVSKHPWVPQLGISLTFGMDGLSLLMSMLALFLGIVSVACSWNEISDKAGLYWFNLLWTIAGVLGVFLSLDLFLFYFFWELMLIPMYFLIAVWGHEKRVYAALKFFIFTQGCSLFLLVAILALYFVHGAESGTYTFDYFQLLKTHITGPAVMWIMLGCFVGFAVKLPAFPLHPWLPDAHTEAPTAGSVLLAGILLKTGAYGLLRFVIPLFPDAARSFAPIAMALGVAGIMYGGFLAFAQTDLKRLVAYTSVSHLGFVLLGIFAFNQIALQGVVIEMICHGLSTGGLFVLVGMLDARLHTRDMDRLGGLWKIVPRLSSVGLFLALASLGLPGLGNFVGEFLILLGSYPASPLLTALGTFGLVIGTVYSLWLVQRTFQGRPLSYPSVSDVSLREGVVMAAMVIGLLWIGLYPQPFIDAATPSVTALVIQMGER